MEIDRTFLLYMSKVPILLAYYYPSLSSLCAQWSGYGPHLALLERLITLGHDFSEDTFNHGFTWPPITPELYACRNCIEFDPFLLQFLCQCSKRAYGKFLPIVLLREL